MTHTEQKSRAELIEEIVGEFHKDYVIAYTGILPDKVLEAGNKWFESFLRIALLRISDASMDAVEVKEDTQDYSDETKWPHETFVEANGYNAAITASKQRRTLFTK